MNIIKKFFFQRKCRKQLVEEVKIAAAQFETTMHVFHDIVATIGIDRMQTLLDEAKKRDEKYVSLARWYIDELQQRRDAWFYTRGK